MCQQRSWHAIGSFSLGWFVFSCFFRPISIIWAAMEHVHSNLKSSCAEQKDSSHERESMIRELKLDSMVEFSVRLVTLNFTHRMTSLRR